jgi:hypothetical protein
MLLNGAAGPDDGLWDRRKARLLSGPFIFQPI